MKDVTDGLSNTLAFSELKYRQKGPVGPSYQDTRGTWAYGVMGANIFSTRFGPNTAQPDGVWGCRNTPQEGMPCVQEGTPYANLWASARSYHPSGVQTCLADGSVRFVSNNINLLTWQNLGSRGGGETLSDFSSVPVLCAFATSLFSSAMTYQKTRSIVAGEGDVLFEAAVAHLPWAACVGDCWLRTVRAGEGLSVKGKSRSRASRWSAAVRSRASR
jgi:hypothetical protein